MGLRPALMIWLVLVALTVAARADVVLTKDGRRLEGEIVSESKKAIVVETSLGRVTVPRDDVREIVRGKSPRQQFDERFVGAKDDVPALLELARWAAEASLKSEARKCYRRVVELEPEHVAANEALGRVRYKGEWMTPKERDARAAADERRAREARGLVEYEGRWVTSDEKSKLEQGLVPFAGEWLTVAEAKARQGLGELDGEWVALPLAEGARHAREVMVAAHAQARSSRAATRSSRGPGRASSSPTSQGGSSAPGRSSTRSSPTRRAASRSSAAERRSSSPGTATRSRTTTRSRRSRR